MTQPAAAQVRDHAAKALGINPRHASNAGKMPATAPQLGEWGGPDQNAAPGSGEGIRSDLVIPCINGKRTQVPLEEARVRPGSPKQPNTDPYSTRGRPTKCNADNCPDYHHCQGIFLPYLEIYGDDELEYRPDVARVLLGYCCRQTNVFDRKKRPGE